MSLFSLIIIKNNVVIVSSLYLKNNSGNDITGLHLFHPTVCAKTLPDLSVLSHSASMPLHLMPSSFSACSRPIEWEEGQIRELVDCI